MTESQRQRVFTWLDRCQDFSWSLPSDFLSRKHFIRVVLNLDWTSTPGYPYNKYYNDNRAFFGVKNGLPSWERMNYVWNLVCHHINEKVSDPIYVFVKQEPHLEKKRGRVRLISSVSVVDQIIDHMLFDAFNEKIIDQSKFGSVKVGWTPYLGGWKTVPLKGISIDKSAWDWTMQPWLFSAILDFKRSRCVTDTQRDLWLELASWRYRCLFFEARFYLPNGLVIEQTEPGVMKSGSVVTIVDNSLAQLILHYRVYDELGWEPGKEEYIWVCGDDTRQSKPPDVNAYLDRLSQFCKVKEFTERCEFVGCRFYRGGRIEPLYKGKHAYNLLYADPAIEQNLAFSYALLYGRSREFPYMRKILSAFGQPMSTEQVHSLWDDE